MQTEPILLYCLEEDLHKLKIHAITEHNIKDVMNGESGYHIYHVKKITELLLRELSVSRPELSLSEEDIIAVSMASSLHDIGKMQVPQSILNKPGTLSPVEYDIVKKHSIFGEKMIRNAQPEGVEPQVIEYALQIAKYHHERIDGAGYPEGLCDDEIPLCAKVVALADVFDALTSPRSYKEAFSQDVAIQMITNGMCGAFDEELVECLMRVVNHRSLVTFREKLLKAGKVVEDHSAVLLKRVLLIGNTEYITKDFVDMTFPGSKVMVVGNTELGGKDTIKLFRVRKPSVKAILETYEFDLIVFFSDGLRFHSSGQSDSEQLREVLKYSKKLQSHAKVLYLSSLETAFEEKGDKAILAEANEKMCEHYASRCALDAKIVRIPYLYSSLYKEDFLYDVFDAMYTGKTVQIPESSSTAMHFLSLNDLSELIIRIVDNWTTGGGILSVGDEFHLSFMDFAEKLREIQENVKVAFHETHVRGGLKLKNSALRSEYGWFAKISILEDLADQYSMFAAKKQEQKRTFFEKAKGWIAANAVFVKNTELILLFLLAEFFIRLTDSAVTFSIVDFRTIYIVIMATLYGLPYGIASASLSSVSYFIARVMEGTNALTIFYEPTNWLAFVFFFLVGGLCGYVNLRKDDNSKYLKEQNKLLEDKLTFTGEIYEDILREKRELKKQIISSKDSFGKIFDITRRLNTIAPQQLYLRIIDTFEEILENKSITVYSVKPGTAFGRLEVSSRDLLDAASRSIMIDAYAPVIEKLKDGEIWKNTELNSDYPMYAAGVYRGDELVLVIFLWSADIDQKSLYYVNLFKILRDLVQMSLLRAYDYHAALADKQYIENTRIMKAEFFEDCVRNYVELSERKVSTFVLLEFDLNGHTLEEASAMIMGKVRNTDILGIREDGKLQLLLSQATEKDLTFILPRFEGLDLITTVVK